MQILSLTLQNIHSLAGKHTIDFTKPPLANTGLFAIVGPTGAGKSTILDAITFALFDSISRFGSGSLRSIILNEGGVITRGRDEAFAQVRYLIDGQVFISQWKAHLDNRTMVVMNEDGEVLAAGVKEVRQFNSEKIGLNYEQFVRSVILPQGQFAAFLRADSDQRIEILEKITGTGIYRTISQHVYNRTKQKEETWKLLKSQLESIELLSENQRAEISEKINALHEIDKYLTRVIKSLEQILQLKRQILDKKQQLNKSQETLNRLNQEQEQFKPQLERLALHKKALPFLGELTRLAEYQEQIKKLATQIQKLQNNLSQLRQRISLIQQQEQKQTQTVEQLSQRLERLLPILKQARELQNKINQLQTLKADNNQSLEKLNSQITSLSEQIQTLKTQIKRLKTQKLQLEEQLEKAKILEQLVQEQSEIIPVLEVYDNQRESIRDFIRKNLPSLDSEIQLVGAQLQEDIERISSYKQQILEQIRKLEQDLGADVSLAKLNERLEQLADVNSDLSKAITIANTVAQLDQQRKQVAKQVQELRTRVQQAEQYLKQTEELVKARETQVQIAEKERDLERMKQSSAFIREQLSDGDQCPVCGNVFHSAKAPEIPALRLAQLEQRLEQAKQNREKAQQQYAQALSQLQKVQTELNEREEILNNLKQQIDSAKQQILQILQKHGFKPEVFTVEQITELQLSVKQQIDKIQHAIQNLQMLEQLRQKLDLTNQLLEQLNNLYQLRQRLTLKLKPFSAYLKGLKDIPQIIARLKDLIKYWNSLAEKAMQLDKDLEQKNITLEQLEKQQKQLHSQAEQIQQKLQKIQDEINSLAEQKQQILTQADLDPQMDVDKIEQQLRKDLEDKTKQLQDLRNNLVALRSQNKSLTEQFQQLQQQHNDIQAQTNELQSQLSERLTKAGFMSIEQARAALLTSEEAQKIEQRERELREAIKAQEKQLNLLKTELDKLLNQDQVALGVEQVEEKLTQLESLQQRINQNIGKFNKELETDEQNRKKAEQLNQELEQAAVEYQRWDRLNQLIGSASGDKFQRIVQEYNFQILVNEANWHLQRLAPRYSLNYQPLTGRKQGFELYVVDNEMAGQQRNVRSLSGGETFLVSLALALALSSMASHKVQLYNLFIDEGFGSLDTQTLEMALSTLERLQMQTNRQIGIISHVEPLKERIPVKILVQKQSGGISSIVIPNVT